MTQTREGKDGEEADFSWSVSLESAPWGREGGTQWALRKTMDEELPQASLGGVSGENNGEEMYKRTDEELS